MKNFNTIAIRLALLVIVSFSFSCKKLQESPQSSDDDKLTTTNSALYVPETIFTPAQHTFTDVHICYDDKIFLLENGKLKRLIENALVDVNLPVSIYNNNFKPSYLAISKDYTFYLRSSTGIKIVKGGQLIKEYKVGQPPLQNYTPETFGEQPVAVDETDQSLVVGVPQIYNPGLVSLLKIAKNGQAGQVFPPEEFEESFFTTFDIGGPKGQLWIATFNAFTEYYYAKMWVLTAKPQSFGYASQNVYGYSPDNHNPFPLEGYVDSVGYRITAGIRVSKDAKTVYLKTGEYEQGPQPISNTGYVLRIKDNQVKAIAKDVENKRMAISNNGKTLYLAGNGLSKIEF